MKIQRLYTKIYGIPLVLFILPFVLLMVFSTIEQQINRDIDNQIFPGIVQNPYGWRWISTESTAFARTIRPKEFQLLVPTPRNRIMFQGSQDGVPNSGIVLRSSAPVWSDPNGTQLITRLTQGETVHILAREPWRSQFPGVIYNYLIEDQLGNRGYVGSDVLMLPIQQFGNFQLGKIEMIETLPNFNPPFLSNQRIGSVVSLPVIQTPQDFYVLVPDSLNQDTLLFESQNELFTLAFFQVSGSHQLEYLVFYGRNEMYQANINQNQLDSDFYIAGVSTGIFQSTQIIQTSELLSLQPGFLVNAAIPFRSNLTENTRTSIPLSTIGNPANFFEFMSNRNNQIEVHQIVQPITPEQSLRFIRIFNSIPRNQSLRVNESNVALRSGPSQGSPLLRRIQRDTDVRIIGVHLPSAVILNNRFFWLQIELLEQEEEIYGWMWGEFLLNIQ
jgi:hypothetical protein